MEKNPVLLKLPRRIQWGGSTEFIHLCICLPILRVKSVFLNIWESHKDLRPITCKIEICICCLLNLLFLLSYIFPSHVSLSLALNHLVPLCHLSYPCWRGQACPFLVRWLEWQLLGHAGADGLWSVPSPPLRYVTGTKDWRIIQDSYTFVTVFLKTNLVMSVLYSESVSHYLQTRT